MKWPIREDLLKFRSPFVFKWNKATVPHENFPLCSFALHTFCQARPIIVKTVAARLTMENFKKGDLAEAVDTLGVWARCRVLECQNDFVVMTFPPWPKDWNRKITDPAEIRSLTVAEVLVERGLQHDKVSCFLIY